MFCLSINKKKKYIINKHYIFFIKSIQYVVPFVLPPQLHAVYELPTWRVNVTYLMKCSYFNADALLLSGVWLHPLNSSPPLTRTVKVTQNLASPYRTYVSKFKLTIPNKTDAFRAKTIPIHPREDHKRPSLHARSKKSKNK